MSGEMALGPNCHVVTGARRSRALASTSDWQKTLAENGDHFAHIIRGHKCSYHANSSGFSGECLAVPLSQRKRERAARNGGVALTTRGRLVPGMAAGRAANHRVNDTFTAQDACGQTVGADTNQHAMNQPRRPGSGPAIQGRMMATRLLPRPRE